MNRIDETVDKYLVESKMKEFDSYVKKIAKLTDKNDHTTARKVAAELMLIVTKKPEYEGFVNQYDGIAYSQKKAGSLTDDLKYRRDNTDKAFFDKIKKDLPKNMFDALWKSF